MTKKDLRNLQPLPLSHRCAYHAFRTAVARAGLDKRYRKIFAIGFNKSGTTSINALFERAGIHTLHDIRWRPDHTPSLLYRFQAFTDGEPNVGQIASLDENFRGARFILNTRELDEWLDSRLQHIRHAGQLGVLRQSEFWDATDKAVKKWVTKRNDYHLAVLRHFEARPEDLLIVNYVRDPDAPRKIGDFVGLHGGEEKPFVRPIEKTRSPGVLSNSDMIDRCLSDLGVPKEERHLDLYCPSLVEDNADLRFPNDTGELEPRSAHWPTGA